MKKGGQTADCTPRTRKKREMGGGQENNENNGQSDCSIHAVCLHALRGLDKSGYSPYFAQTFLTAQMFRRFTNCCIFNEVTRLISTKRDFVVFRL